MSISGLLSAIKDRFIYYKHYFFHEIGLTLHILERFHLRIHSEHSFIALAGVYLLSFLLLQQDRD